MAEVENHKRVTVHASGGTPQTLTFDDGNYYLEKDAERTLLCATIDRKDAKGDLIPLVAECAAAVETPAWVRAVLRRVLVPDIAKDTFVCTVLYLDGTAQIDIDLYYQPETGLYWGHESADLGFGGGSYISVPYCAALAGVTANGRPVPDVSTYLETARGPVRCAIGERIDGLSRGVGAPRY